MNPTIDIIIVNFRGVHEVIQNLEQLGAWPHGTVWLVDNSAHEADMAADTAALHQAGIGRPWVTLLTPGINLGFGRACNLAFSKSTADFVLLLNPDARITPDNVLLLARALAEEPRLGAVAPEIFWNEQHSFVLPPAFPQTPWYSMAMALATYSRDATRWTAHLGLSKAIRQMAPGQVSDVGFLAGAVMMLRRAAVLSAGCLFDPEYFMFFEDSDLSLRLRSAGYALAIVSDAHAVHEYRHKAYKAGLMAQSQQQYFRKQFPTFYRLSNKLARLATAAKPIDPVKWFKVLPRLVTTAADFAELTGGAPVMAFSPSLLMMPAIFRPSIAEARSFDDREWALLEPATYVALLDSLDLSLKPNWVYFERAA